MTHNPQHPAVSPVVAPDPCIVHTTRGGGKHFQDVGFREAAASARWERVAEGHDRVAQPVGGGGAGGASRLSRKKVR